MKMTSMPYSRIRNKKEDLMIRKLHKALGGSGRHGKFLEPNYKFHSDLTCTVTGYYIDNNFKGTVSETFDYLCEQTNGFFSQRMNTKRIKFLNKWR